MDLQLALGFGRVDEARRLLMERLKRNPEDVTTWLLLGWTANTPEAARVYFEKALQLSPNNPLAQDGLVYVEEWLKSMMAGTYVPGQAAPGSWPAEVSASASARSAAAAAIPIDQAATTPVRVEVGWKTRVDRASITRTVKVGIGKLTKAAAYDRKVSGRTLLLYLAAITLAETLTTLLFPAVGLIGHGIILLILLIHGSLFVGPEGQKMLLSLALAPLIRLISLSMPLTNFPFYLWYLIVGAPLFISAFFVARMAGFKRKEIGLNLCRWPLQLVLSVIGIGLGLTEYLILRPNPLVPVFDFQHLWFPALILVIFTGLLEEVIFRGLMQRAFLPSLGKWRGLLYVSVLFGVLHLGYQSALDLVFVFAVAMIFGLIVEKTGSLLGVTIAHGLTNVTLFLVFPFVIGSAPIFPIPGAGGQSMLNQPAAIVRMDEQLVASIARGPEQTSVMRPAVARFDSIRKP